MLQRRYSYDAFAAAAATDIIERLTVDLEVLPLQLHLQTRHGDETEGADSEGGGCGGEEKATRVSRKAEAGWTVAASLQRQGNSGATATAVRAQRKIQRNHTSAALAHSRIDANPDCKRRT